MSKVRFCVEEFEENNQYSLKRHYNLERLEKVLGKNFWYREEKLRKLLKEFIEFPYIENMIELLKVTPHAPVYDKKELKDFQPNVLLITNEPGLNYDVIKNLYLKPLRILVEGSYKNIGCIFGYQIALKELIEKMIQRFNRSMFSWLTLTPLRELGNKINGDSVKPIRNDCGVLQNITSQNSINDQKLKKIVYCLKKISYWFPTDDRQSSRTNLVDQWMKFIKREEPRVIHWDLLPYAQYGEEKNDINDEIREIIEEVEQKNFQNIRNEIISKASYKQSLWYVKLLDKFLEAFEEVNIEEGNFFILVVGNRIIRGRDRREILGHLFAGLYKHNKDIKDATVIFRDEWCSCNKGVGNLYFIKFSEFLNPRNRNFDWQTFDSKLNGLRGTSSTYYGGKNKIPCR